MGSEITEKAVKTEEKEPDRFKISTGHRPFERNKPG
jgi:hypothetical protein